MRKKNYFINQEYLSEYATMPAYRCELQDIHDIHLSGLEWIVYSHMWWCSTMPHGEGDREDKLAPIFDGNPYHPRYCGGIFVVEHLADNLDVAPEQIEKAIVSLEAEGLIISQTQVSPDPEELYEWVEQYKDGVPVYPLPYPRNVPDPDEALSMQKSLESRSKSSGLSGRLVLSPLSQSHKVQKQSE